MVPITTWEIKRSIAFELDILFNLLNDFLLHASHSPIIADFMNRIPEEILTEYRLLMGENKYIYSLMIPAAYAVGMVFEEDYPQVTLMIRQMEMEDVIKGFIRQGLLDGINLERNLNLPLLEQLIQIDLELNIQSGLRLGFHPDQNKHLIQNTEKEMKTLSRFLKDGDLHTRFWHWMDRFFYQIIFPWRSERMAIMNTEEERARLALGAPGSPVPVDWLPQSHPLRINSEIIGTKQTRGLHVIFITEPFQLPDFWEIIPHGLVTSYAEGKDLYRNFFAFIDDLSTRLKALADPTRLAILRAIGSSPQDNTLIATHLGVSRPTVSIHAKQLRKAGLIMTYEEGRSVRHEVVHQEMRRLIHDLERFLDLPPEETEELPEIIEKPRDARIKSG